MCVCVFSFNFHNNPKRQVPFMLYPKRQVPFMLYLTKEETGAQRE